MKQLLIFFFTSCFTAFQASAQSQLENYKMNGPYEVVARDGAYAYTKSGSEQDWWTAWQCAQHGQAGKAVEIINAYSRTLQRFDGHDAPLCCIQAYWLLRSMTLLNAEGKMTREESDAAQDMVRRAMLPVIEKFEADSPYANGNWGHIVNRCRIAASIFLGDKDLYQQAIDIYLHANDNGSLPHYVSETGQCQETGRDQAHAQLGLGAMCDICEMAWEQGDDLWGSLDNRLMRGIEYSARYNLGYDVPFQIWKDCTGLYCDWTKPAGMGRGTIRCIYDQPYRHYVIRKGLEMPYTKKLLGLQRKAAEKGGIRHNPEADEFTVEGVKASQKLHQVFAYPAPEGAPLKHDYDVYARPRGSEEWIRIDTYMAKVNAAVGENRHKVSEISYALFDFTGDVFVRVVCKNRKYTTVRVRPDYKGVIARTPNDSTAEFLLFQPENVSVEFDGDITANLLLFTSKPPVTKEEAAHEAKDQGRAFVCFEPGLYRQDRIKVASNTTVWIAGGAYFTGTFTIEDVENVSILGRGIARPADGYEGCHVHRSRNVLIDGLTVNTCPVGESDGVTLHDVRSISHPSWGDGLNVFASSNVLFDRVFCRNSDDCTTAYATRKGFSGSTRNITMRNSTLWADVAHPIFIGIHGNAERGDTIEQLRYENIDILGQAEPQVDYQGCLAINCGDNNLVRDVVFDNIRVEQILKGSLLQVKVGYNQKYCTAPGRGVENITFRNIRYYGDLPRSLSIINGYDDSRQVSNISFEGLKVNGRLIHDRMKDKPAWYATADYLPMYVGNHVSNVSFSADSRQSMVSRSLAYCSSQTDRALESLRPYDFTMMPRNILKGETTWNLRKAKPEEWCSGFWPGILWMDFAYNKSEAVGKAARGYTDAILSVVSQPVYDHDLGFITINALMKGYEVSKDERYCAAALRAADSLATLFNPSAGTILSWPRHVKDYGGHNTIMDNMMNLELLFWATEHGGSKQLKDIALSHALTTMKNQFRPDGSCFHVAVYDSLSGKFIKGVTHQGFRDQSMWSRGQAWAIYGYTMTYRHTHDPQFLTFAQKVADIYLKRLKETSDDMVPYWDMDDPRIRSDRSHCPKDASAAAVVASALIELHRFAPTKGYREQAEKMLADLNSDSYQSRDRNVSFLMHSTGHHPAGTEIDASIIYADYYYLEALMRLYNEF
jgi:hypothetical protein